MAVLSTAAKRKIAGSAIIAMAVWPVLHYLLVSHYHVDPWRHFGWQYIAQPRPEPLLRVAMLGNDEKHLEFDKSAPIERELHAHNVLRVQHELRRPLVDPAYLVSRQVWGRLAAPPDDIAANIFAAIPDVDRLRIGVLVPYIGKQTGRRAFRRSDYYYQRE